MLPQSRTNTKLVSSVLTFLRYRSFRLHSIVFRGFHWGPCLLWWPHLGVGRSRCSGGWGWGHSDLQQGDTCYMSTNWASRPTMFISKITKQEKPQKGCLLQSTCLHNVSVCLHKIYQNHRRGLKLDKHHLGYVDVDDISDQMLLYLFHTVNLPATTRKEALTVSDSEVFLSSARMPSFQRFSSCANSACFCCFIFTAISLLCQLFWRCSSRWWMLCVAVPTLLGDNRAVFCGDAAEPIEYCSTAAARFAMTSLKSLPLVTGLRGNPRATADGVFTAGPGVAFLASRFSLSIFFCQFAVVADTGWEVAALWLSLSVVSLQAASLADTGLAVGSSPLTRVALRDGLQVVVLPGTILSFTSSVSSDLPRVTLISLTTCFFAGDAAAARLLRGGLAGPTVCFGVSVVVFGGAQTFLGGSFGLKI